MLIGRGELKYTRGNNYRREFQNNKNELAALRKKERERLVGGLKKAGWWEYVSMTVDFIANWGF